MTSRKYFIYDVFTRQALAGNPLAVVVDCDGLDTAGMQAMAREFNLSETVFVLPPENKLHRARIRIFTASYEMPFAGHPTVGTAIALAEQAADDGAAGIFVLEENIGPVRCAVSRQDGASFAEFDLPRLPERLEMTADAAAIGAALGLRADEVGFENHRVGLWSAGVPYLMVPVAGLAAAAKARLDTAAWLDIAPKRPNDVPASAYVYCRETVNHESSFHARMFVGENPTYEDPATGSAAAAFAGAVNYFEQPVDGRTVVWIEQGVEMGRPSLIRLGLDIEAGAIATARIGGHAVKVAEGMMMG